MKWYLLGGYIDDLRMKHFLRLSNGNIDFAANVTQKRIIEGLNENTKALIHVISTPFIKTFPRYSRSPSIRFRDKVVDCIKTVTEIGYINIEYFKIISRSINMLRYCKGLQLEGDDIVIAYSMHTPFLLALRSLKKREPQIVNCLMVLDLPEYMRPYRTKDFISRFFKKIDRVFMIRQLKYVDTFVFTTPYMAQILGVHEKPHIVVEGMAPHSNEDTSSLKTDWFIITYTGSLERRFGIHMLLSAIDNIPDERIRLRICGKGEMETEISRFSKKDKRIEWFGAVSPAEAARLQRESTILINPRQPFGEYTKYSFPSKLLEYMVTGRPTLAYKLDGISDDFLPYVLWIRTPGAIGILQAIKQAMLLTEKELDTFGNKAREFILQNKTSTAQSKKIIAMINNFIATRDQETIH